MEGSVGVLLVYVVDFPRMLAFYRDTLGLPLSEVDPGPPYTVGVDWVGFRTGSADIELFQAKRERTLGLPLPRQNAVTIAFKVGRFAEQRDALAAKGVGFWAEGEQEWGRYAHFEDPEGNQLQIYEPNTGY